MKFYVRILLKLSIKEWQAQGFIKALPSETDHDEPAIREYGYDI
jgi:hypothetical protein